MAYVSGGSEQVTEGEPKFRLQIPEYESQGILEWFKSGQWYEKVGA